MSAPSDPVTRLQDDDRQPRLVQPARGGQPGEARSDDADVGFQLLHGVSLPPVPPTAFAVSLPQDALG